MQRLFIIIRVTLVASVLGLPLPASTTAGEEERYMKAAREFADNVLKHGRDVYGPKHTPLLVDGLNVDTREPAKWKRNGTEWVLSNLASQQILFRTLDGLTALTGEPKYRQAACDAIRYAFDNLRSPNGLLHWGGHTAYDAGTDAIVGEGYRHELKCHYPYYELMWQVDPKKTRRFLEACWNAHILNWSNLDMNRHGSYTRKMGKLWAHQYKGGEVFFEGKGLTFINTGSDLFYAAAMLHKLTGEPEPLVWAKRMAHRYVETRNPKTGLGGYQYSRYGPGDRAVKQFGPEFGDRLLEGTILDPGRARLIYGTVAVCRMTLAESLGSAGSDFLTWAAEDLTAYGKHAYNATDNSFRPMITDGTDLTDYALKRNGYYGRKGKVLKPSSADTLMLWAYARAFRMTGEAFLWQMARDIARGNDLGDIGAAPGDKPALNHTTACAEPQAIFGLLELHRKTGEKPYWELAKRVGDNIVAERFHKGFFVASKRHVFARSDAVEPLALLHVVAAMRGTPNAVPTYPAGRSYFHCPFDGKGRTYDLRAIYSRRRNTSAE